ncbi:helix-turn-helix domain-containing protein [Nonomuraea sp. NPDC050556]|uniref:helix-turn-helix domain-containing protein n=1 Tax=Nonomuraea sp. NPDC050556 TaxID=3364369 RepID=UPI0037A90790
MTERSSPVVRRLRLGQELKLLRERRRLTGRDVAEALGWSPSKVSRIESSKTMPSAEDIEALGRLYDLDDEKLTELLELLRDADKRGWWETYEGELPEEYIRLLGMEDEATVHRHWEPQLVPGLLQTEDYARAIILAGRGISRIAHSGVRARMDARLERQKHVLDRADPPMIHTVIDESALLRRFGEASVMRTQMEHLLELSVLPHVSVRILPLDGDHTVHTGAFVHLTFSSFDNVVYLEHLYSARFVEDQELVTGYELAFDEVQVKALDEDDSRVVIQRKATFWRR